MKQQEVGATTGTQSISVRSALQIVCSFALTSIIAVVAWNGLHSLGLPSVLVMLLVLLCCAFIGLLLTINIHYALFLLDLALSRLAQQESVSGQEEHSSPWPFAPLFASIQSIAVRMHHLLQHEQSDNAHREQLLRRASEEAAEQERNRIARELHDSIKQQLFSIRMSAAAAQKGTGTQEGHEAIEDIRKSAEEAQVEMQALLQQLRSAALENTSLAEALRTQALALGYRTGAQVSVDIGDLPSADFCPPSMQEAVFRIVQEACANIARHARAHTVSFVLLQQDHTLAITVRDDGQGFDMHNVRRGMGTANIQERAHALGGSADIHSAPGEGTTVQVSIPLLLPPETKQALDMRAYEAQQATLRASSLLQLRGTMMTLTIVVIFVNLTYERVAAAADIKNFSLLILAFSFLGMIYGMVRAHFSIARAAAYLGNETREITALRLEEHRSLSGFLSLLTFILWYALLFYPSWRSFRLTNPTADLLAASVILPAFALVLFILERRPLYRSQQQYYAMLSPLELSWEIQIRTRRVRLLFLIFLLCCLGGPILIAVNHIIAFPPIAATDIWNYFIIVSLIVFCINLAIEMNVLRRWKRKAVVQAMQETAIIV